MHYARKRRAFLFAGLALAIAALVWACVDSAFSEGQFACDPRGSRECPPGLLCAADGRCRSLEVTTTDGSVDAPAPEAEAGDAAPPVDACAIATWTVLTSNRGPSALAVGDDGRLFVGGTAGDGGWLAELDPCDGGTIREKVFETKSATLPSVHDIVITSDELVVTGAADDARAGLFMRFSKSTLDVVQEKAFDGGGGLAGFDSLVRTGDGAYVLGGAKDIFAPTISGWLARVGGSGADCTASVGTTVTGLFVASGDKATVWNGTTGDNQLEVRSFGAGCALGMAQVVPFPGGLRGGVSSMAGAPASPIAVGAYGPALDAGGYDWGLVGSISGTTFTIATPIDPNPGRVDIVQRAVVDGDRLFLAALQSATLTGGTPTLYRYDLPLTAASKPTLTTAIFGGELVAFRGMKTNPKPTADDDALFILGPKPAARASGAITRCRKSTGCR